LAVDLAAKGGAFVDEDRSQVVAGGQGGGGEARWASPDHEQVTARTGTRRRQSGWLRQGGHGHAGMGGKVETPSVLLYAAARAPDFWALHSHVFR